MTKCKQLFSLENVEKVTFFTIVIILILSILLGLVEMFISKTNFLNEHVLLILGSGSVSLICIYHFIALYNAKKELKHIIEREKYFSEQNQRVLESIQKKLP